MVRCVTVLHLEKCNNENDNTIIKNEFPLNKHFPEFKWETRTSKDETVCDVESLACL